jgi:hypothetical protein
MGERRAKPFLPCGNLELLIFKFDFPGIKGACGYRRFRTRSETNKIQMWRMSHTDSGLGCLILARWNTNRHCGSLLQVTSA